MKTLNIASATKRYNSIMNDLGYEHNTIGTDFSENTDNWNLRDMVAECDYVLGTFYEEGHANNEGRYLELIKIDLETLMSKEKFRYYTRLNKEAEEVHKFWLSMTRRLRNFIKAYEPHIKHMNCDQGHCSRFD